MTKCVVVIGAGPGGLAAAMLLAKAGLGVTVVERLPRVGGRTSTLTTDEGFRFDMGPTFFLYPGVLEQVFAHCGLDLHQAVEMKRLDPQYHLIFEQGGDLRCTSDIARMKQQVARISPADAERFEHYLADNRAKFAKFKPILESPFNGPRDLFRRHVMSALPWVRPWASVDGDLKRWFSDERVRLSFSFQSKYLGMSPFKCPSLFTILSFLEYEYGVWHPTGGCGAVSEAMADAARALGVDIRLGEEVQEVLVEGRKAVGVRTHAGEHRGDAVVVNADFAHAMQKLVPDHVRNRWTNRNLAKKKYSCSTFMLYLGIEGAYDDLEHHTIFLSKDYADNLREIETDHVLSDNPSVYVQNACRTDPTLAPDGMSTLYVLAPVTHQHPNVDWPAQQQAFRARVIRQLEKFGVTDLERRIRYEKMLTPVGWEQDMHIYRGATFNLAHNLTQMLHMRPKNRFDDLDSMYLVGGGTHPGSGLPVIYESALISSKLLMEDLGVSFDWSRAAAPGSLSSSPPVERPALVGAR